MAARPPTLAEWLAKYPVTGPRVFRPATVKALDRLPTQDGGIPDVHRNMPISSSRARRRLARALGRHR